MKYQELVDEFLKWKSKNPEAPMSDWYKYLAEVKKKKNEKIR